MLTTFLNKTMIWVAIICIMDDLFWLYFALFQSPRIVRGRAFIVDGMWGELSNLNVTGCSVPSHSVSSSSLQSQGLVDTKL